LNLAERIRMKLVIFGLTISSSWGNGHATLWRGLCNAFARRGHDVVFFERDVPYYALNRDLTRLPFGQLCLYSSWDDALPLARCHLVDADVAMVTSYCPDGIAASDLILDSSVPVRAFYDLDTPVTLARLQAGEPVESIGPRGLGEFDLVLSYTGGRALRELQARLGARRVAPLYGSVDPEVYRRTEVAAQYCADMSYMGTYAADRQPALEQFLVEPARRLPERRFLIGGAQYPEAFPWTTNIFFVRHLPPGEHPAFYSSSRLTLNITRAAMALMGYCPSGRLFEATACGAPILSDAWEGLDTFFEPDSEILVAHDTAGAIGALELSDAELAGIAARARERTLEEHTAARRAAELERAIEAAASGIPTAAERAHDGTAIPRAG
jgi:spore maturation protein CgeB